MFFSSPLHRKSPQTSRAHCAVFRGDRIATARKRSIRHEKRDCTRAILQIRMRNAVRNKPPRDRAIAKNQTTPDNEFPSSLGSMLLKQEYCRTKLIVRNPTGLASFARQ
jgi:hypothetical protein